MVSVSTLDTSSGPVSKNLTLPGLEDSTFCSASGGAERARQEDLEDLRFFKRGLGREQPAEDLFEQRFHGSG